MTPAGPQIERDGGSDPQASSTPWVYARKCSPAAPGGAMRRWAIVVATLVVAMVLTWGLARFGLSARPERSRVNVHGVSWATLARPHPHGLEADEVTTRPARRSWSAGGAAIWTGAGRHPMWRGCQHRYDPALASFIFVTAPPSG